VPCRQFPWYNYRTHIASHLVIPKAAKRLNHPKILKFSCKNNTNDGGQAMGRDEACTDEQVRQAYR